MDNCNVFLVVDTIVACRVRLVRGNKMTDGITKNISQDSLLFILVAEPTPTASANKPGSEG